MVVKDPQNDDNSGAFSIRLLLVEQDVGRSPLPARRNSYVKRA